MTQFDTKDSEFELSRSQINKVIMHRVRAYL